MGNSMTVHDACRQSNIMTVKDLLQKPNFRVEEMDDCGRTPLLAAASVPDGATEDKENIPVDIINLLVEKHANLDHRDEYGRTCLHYACENQNYSALLCLMHHGAHPTRDKVGLLPQDFLTDIEENSSRYAQFNAAKTLLNSLTEQTGYSMKLIGHKSSGIVELNSGGALKAGSLITIKYNAPSNHSEKDYIQMIVFEVGQPYGEFGEHIRVPKESSGEITFGTDSLSVPCICRFIYVKSDTNSISRQVVASECTVFMSTEVEEGFDFEIFLFEKVLEVESVPEIVFGFEPALCLRRIGIAPHNENEEVEWMNVNPGNAIIAVDDKIIAGLDFESAAELLQSHDIGKPMKLLIHNSSVSGDFIPEKVLGPGLIGKYISVSAEDSGFTMEEGGGNLYRDDNDDDLDVYSDVQVNEPSVNESSAVINDENPTVEIDHQIPNGLILVQQLFQDVQITCSDQNKV